MGLQRKERRLTITAGLVLGVVISSLIVKHALDVKNEHASQRPGNYNSHRSAIGKEVFPILPSFLEDAVPNGIILHYESNRTSLIDQNIENSTCWIIETSGSFRSERLFILTEEINGGFPHGFFRASELYIKLKDKRDLSSFEEKLDRELYRVIGHNSSSHEFILQLRNFSPTDLDSSKSFLGSLSEVVSVRHSPWFPSH